VGGAVIAVERARLGAWSERWRYPDLVELLLAADLAEPAARDAIVAGLAAPVSTLQEAVDRLLARGAFAAAESLADLEGRSRDAAIDTPIDAQVTRARKRAADDLGRRVQELRVRGGRVGLQDHPPAVDLDQLQHRADAEVALDQWEGEVTRAEDARAQALEARLVEASGDDHPVWAERVRQCLRARHFPSAERLLEMGPFHAEPIEPEHVRPLDPIWPWEDWPLDEVLAWYLDEAASVPPGFAARWRPAAGDEAARKLVAALAAVVREPGADSSRLFADELDAVLGAADVLHPVQAHGNGFKTRLFGLVDHHLPFLRLPREVPLWTAPSAWPGPGAPEHPAVWLAPEGSSSPPPDGVALLDAVTIFRLVAPSAREASARQVERRINLMRAICPQLTLPDLLGHGDELDLGPRDAMAGRLAWLLDVLGVRVDGTAIDVLLYDTGGHPRALRTALEAILPVGDRPERLDLPELARWRERPDSMEALRRAVLGGLSRDPEAAAVVYALLLAYAGQPAATFTAGDVSELLQVLAGEYPHLPELTGFMDVEVALARTEVDGLVEGRAGKAYGWVAPGLMALLSGTDLEERATEALLRAHRRRGVLAILPVPEPGRKERHLAIGHLSGLSRVLEGLEEVARGDEAVHELVQRAHHHLSHLIEYVPALRESPDELVEAIPLELVSQLRELERRPRPRLHLDVGTDGPATLDVSASPHALRLAFENLLLNAEQTLDAEPAEGIRHVMITASLGDGGASAVVDVEDDGPGLSEEARRRFLDGVSPGPAGGRGRGLCDAQECLAYYGGTIVPLEAPSERLGGAHFRIRLPLLPR
jgi:hypothetical protein